MPFIIGLGIFAVIAAVAVVSVPIMVECFEWWGDKVEKFFRGG